MHDTIIRRAAAGDLAELSRLWLENRTIQQQFDRRITLAADSRAVWERQAGSWLADQSCAVWVGAGENSLFGYTIGWIQPNVPGLIPERLGVITELVLDAHHYQAGLGRALVAALRGWFAGQDVPDIVTVVPYRHAVGQAFWRSLGAVEWVDVMWLK